MNILLVGNGFDLAHGLPTKYNQFLEIMKYWKNVYRSFRYKKMKQLPDSALYAKKFKNVELFDEQNIDKLNEIIESNSWIKYYCECGAEIEGWIDFEREIYPVIKLFEVIFEADSEMTGSKLDFCEAYINKSKFSATQLRIAKLWGKYIEVTDEAVKVRKPYATIQYGLLKKKILQSLREEFDEFIKAFEIYLVEFVHKQGEVKKLKQIKELKIDMVVSFNYTLTEKLYISHEANVHHIHGKIREDIHYVNDNEICRVESERMNSMVVGVNEQENQNMDFIYFVKYFQRIKKQSGIQYKRYLDNARTKSIRNTDREEYHLYIYGHSLDETDKDILETLIGSRREDGKFNLLPQKVFFFYYDTIDYEQKVINLIKLYGRPIVEEYLERGIFSMVPTDCTEC